MKKLWLLPLVALIATVIWLVYVLFFGETQHNYGGAFWVMRRESSGVRVTRLDSQGIMEAVTYDFHGKLTSYERKSVSAERARVLFNKIDSRWGNQMGRRGTHWEGEDWRFPHAVAVRIFVPEIMKKSTWSCWFTVSDISSPWQSLLKDFQQLWENGHTVAKK